MYIVESNVTSHGICRGGDFKVFGLSISISRAKAQIPKRQKKRKGKGPAVSCLLCVSRRL